MRRLIGRIEPKYVSNHLKADVAGLRMADLIN